MGFECVKVSRLSGYLIAHQMFEVILDGRVLHLLTPVVDDLHPFGKVLGRRSRSLKYILLLLSAIFVVAKLRGDVALQKRWPRAGVIVEAPRSAGNRDGKGCPDDVLGAPLARVRHSQCGRLHGHSTPRD